MKIFSVPTFESMIAHIHIKGIIGNLSAFDESVQGEPFVELADVMSQVGQARKQGEITGYLFHIGSPGGSVEVGDDIYNYMQSLKSEGTVDTITSDNIGSIATKIFLAGDKRTIVGNHRFFIHNPLFNNITGNADFLEMATAELRETEKDLAKLYATTTGHKADAILSLMRNETEIDGAKAVELGFATEHKTESLPVALAYIPKKQTKKEEPMSENKMVDRIMKEVKKMLASNKKTNIDLSLEGGAVLRIAEAEDEEMAKGKAAMIVDAEGVETQAAEGELKLADGRTVMIDAEGKLMSISEMANDEMAALKAKIKDLESKLAEKTTVKTDEKELESLLENVKKASEEMETEKQKYVEMQEEMRAMKTALKIPEKKTFRKEVESIKSIEETKANLQAANDKWKNRTNYLKVTK